MTTNHHTPIPADRQPANAATFNAPIGQLDAQVSSNKTATDRNTGELTGARSGFGSLNDRLDSFAFAGGNVATLTNGVQASGASQLTVDATTGFIIGARIVYTTAAGLEYNQIDDLPDATHIDLTDATGGEIADDQVVAMVSESEYQAAQALVHDASVTPTLPSVVQWAAGGWFDVRAFGGGTDKSAAVNGAALAAALTAAATLGGVVNIPPGTYHYDTTIDLPANVHLHGSGPNATILEFDGTGDAVTVNDADYSRLTGVRIKRGTGGDTGIKVIGLEYGAWRDVVVDGFDSAGEAGVHIAAELGHGVYYCDFINVSFVNNATGLIIESTDGATNGYRANANLFANCTFHFNDADGVYLRYANANLFSMCSWEANGGYGIDIDNTYGGIFTGYIENNTAGGVEIGATTSRIEFMGGRVIDAIGGAGVANVGNKFHVGINYTLDPDGNATFAGLVKTTGIGINGAAPVAGVINGADGWLIRASGTSVIQLNTGFINAMAGLKVAGGSEMTGMLAASVLYDPGAINAGANVTTVVTCTGASPGDTVLASHTLLGSNALIVSAHVQSTNNVRVTIRNPTGSTVTITDGGTLKVAIFKF